MGYRLRYVSTVAALVVLALATPLSAQASTALQLRASVNPNISNSMPLVRVYFSQDVRASALPALDVHPALLTTWEQIGPRAVQAVVRGRLWPLAHYALDVPTALRCSPKCSFTSVRVVDAGVATDVNWLDQLLATLHYLPLTFTPTVAPSDPASPTTGTYTWSYANLPSRLSALWQPGAANVILTGALMAFQNDHQLPTTGGADVATWRALVSAVDQHQVDDHPYSYVDVSMSQPETLTLYVGRTTSFHSLVNTGISVSPTQLGTYPVYLRYTSQTMSGTNPDGTHYSDPGIPWVSYFNGGDALHGFIRSTYGWPQSLGCVEMPFAAAKTIWPSTPIGTLVSVH